MVLSPVELEQVRNGRFGFASATKDKYWPKNVPIAYEIAKSICEYLICWSTEYVLMPQNAFHCSISGLHRIIALDSSSLVQISYLKAITLFIY